MVLSPHHDTAPPRTASTRSAVLVALACTALQAAPAASAAAFYSSASGSVVTTKLFDEGATADIVLSMLKAIARAPRLDTRIYSRHESTQVAAVQALAQQLLAMEALPDVLADTNILTTFRAAQYNHEREVMSPERRPGSGSGSETVEQAGAGGRSGGAGAPANERNHVQPPSYTTSILQHVSQQHETLPPPAWLVVAPLEDRDQHAWQHSGHFPSSARQMVRPTGRALQIATACEAADSQCVDGEYCLAPLNSSGACTVCPLSTGAGVCGCSDHLASNYNPAATILDTSCEYQALCDGVSNWICLPASIPPACTSGVCSPGNFEPQSRLAFSGTSRVIRYASFAGINGEGTGGAIEKTGEGNLTIWFATFNNNDAVRGLPRAILWHRVVACHYLLPLRRLILPSCCGTLRATVS